MSIASHDQSVEPSWWRPLRVPVFRNLLLASFVSDIGAFMPVVGAAWLRLSLRAGPIYVALIQTASALPYVLLALPAGAVGDIVDRRKLILCTELWMVGVAAVLTILTITAGGRFRCSDLKEAALVPKDDLPSASALNGIEFNLARAVGPTLAGAVIALWGVGRAFLLNTLSLPAVIFVIAR